MKIKDKHLFELLKEYLTTYLPLQRIVSPLTVKSYRETLNLYLNFLCSERKLQLKDIGFAEINTDTINSFLEWLGTYHGCGLNTQNHHLSVIRAFLKYAGAKDPMLNSYYLASFQVPRRKADKQLTVKHFSEEVLNAILKQPNPKVRNQHRDLFFMILLYDTGARDSEILGLTPKDVVANTSAPYIIVHGKGKKIRMVPIMEETTFHYKSYLKRFHKDLDEDSPLFYTVIHGVKQQMSDDNVARFIHKYADMGRNICPSIPKRVTPHMFRHSRALNLYRKGVPLPLLSEWLGHANLETTLIYAYADTEMKRAAIEKATDANHPLRKAKDVVQENYDELTIKTLYGLC